MGKTVSINKSDLDKLLGYMMLLDEKKDYEENERPKNHIWLVIKRIMKQVKYKM